MKSRALRNSAVMLLQALTTGVTLFALYRFLLIWVGAEALGIWAVVSSTAFLGRLADFGVASSVVKVVAREIAVGAPKSAAAAMETAILFVIVVSGVVLLAVYPLFLYGLVWLLPPQAGDIGSALAPILLLSTWISIIATTVCSGLDGTQRYDLRGLVLIVNSTMQLAAAVLLVPRAGLSGMAWALVIQWSSTLGLGWVLLRRELTGLPLIPHRYRLAPLCELVRYGLRIQAAWVVILFADPVTKSLICRFGALDMVAYFDMASRLLMQFRQLAMSSTQILTAMVADLSETAPDRIRSIYAEAFAMLAAASILGYAAVAICIPLISEMWIGRLQPEFITFALALAGATFVNTLSCPAFFANLGLGNVRENMVSLATHGISNAVLGTLLGSCFGGIGVVLGAALAMLLGSLVLIVSFGRTHHIRLAEIFPRANLSIMAAALAVVLVDYHLQHVLGARLGTPAVCAAALTLFASVVLPIAWYHPMRRAILSQSLGR